jgi:DNA-binding transcriptional LysR family regulator
MVERGEVDIALIYRPTDAPLAPALESHDITGVRFGVCVPRGHPLATREVATIEEVLRERLISFPAGYTTHGLVADRLLDRANNLTCISNSGDVALQMAAAGLGVTILSELRTATELLITAGEVCFVPLEESSRSSAVLATIFPAGENGVPLLDWTLGELERQLREFLQRIGVSVDASVSE